jgi:LysM repeat protein
MKPRRFTIGLYLLALASLIVGLGACTQSLEEREAQSTQPVGVPTESGAPAVGGERAAAPGETVVSVVTPVPEAPGAGTAPTVVTVGETPPVVPTEEPQSPSATAAPSPSQPQPSGGQAGAITHTVQQGETLSSIAQRYGTTWQAIANANGLQNPNQIYVGQKLTIPTGSGGTSGGTGGCRLRHTVQQGEWVWQIARRYGTSPYDILASNGLTIQSANTIYPGTVLCIP